MSGYVACPRCHGYYVLFGGVQLLYQRWIVAETWRGWYYECPCGWTWQYEGNTNHDKLELFIKEDQAVFTQPEQEDTRGDRGTAEVSRFPVARDTRD